MIALTRLVIYSLLSRNGEASVDEVKDILVHKMPQAGIPADWSPSEIEAEVGAIVVHLRLYFAELGLLNCFEVDSGKIIVNNDCRQAVRELYESYKKHIEVSETHFAYYGRKALEVLELLGDRL